MRVTGSAVAGVAPPLKSRLEHAKGGFVSTALFIGVFAAGFLGAGGMIGSYFIDRQRNAHIASRQKQVLADYYRVPVAATLGIDPNKITARDLQMAAQVNPQIANAIARVDREKDSQNRLSLMATGGGLAGGAMLAGAGWLPGISGINNTLAHGVAHTVGSVGGSVAGMAANPLFDKPVLNTDDVMQHINEKRQKGEAVTSKDIFLLRIAQDEDLQMRIKKQTGGHAFHKMNEAQQQVVIQSMPELLAAAENDAQLLNSGRMDEAMLVMHSPGMQKQVEQQGWANRVGGSRMRAGSFVSRVNADREQQRNGIMVPNV